MMEILVGSLVVVSVWLWDVNLLGEALTSTNFEVANRALSQLGERQCPSPPEYGGELVTQQLKATRCTNRTVRGRQKERGME